MLTEILGIESSSIFSKISISVSLVLLIRPGLFLTPVQPIVEFTEPFLIKGGRM